jgi:hypothetical protein
MTKTSAYFSLMRTIVSSAHLDAIKHHNLIPKGKIPMKNSYQFNGVVYNFDKASNVSRLAKAIGGHRRRSAEAFSVAAEAALYYTTKEKGSNPDPINLLLGVATPSEKRDLISVIKGHFDYLIVDSENKVSFAAKGAEAEALRVYPLPEDNFNLKSIAAEVKAAEAAASSDTDGEAAAPAAMTEGDKAKVFANLKKKIDKIRAECLSALATEGPDSEARLSVQAEILKMLPLINIDVLAARVHQDVELIKAVENRQAAEAAAKAASAKATAAASELAAAIALQKAAEAEAAAKLKAEAEAEAAAKLKAEADAKAADKAAYYAKLTAAAVNKMTADKRGQALTEISRLQAAGLIDDTAAEAAKAKIAAKALKAAKVA